MPARIKYKRPPIIERIIGVYHEIPPDVFNLRLPEWVEKISKTYSRPDHLAEWEIEIEDRNGVPIVKTLQPRAKIIHLFWKPHPKGEKVFGMRLRPDRLVFHLRREGEDPHEFEELYAEAKEWLHLWAAHFGVGAVSGITLEYVNILSHRLTPQFIGAGGGIQVGEALTIFTNIPGKHKGLTNPYECKVRLLIDPDKPCHLDVKVRLLEDEPTRVRIDMVATTLGMRREVFLPKALEEIEFAHDVMLEQFDCFFTDKAKQSFLPDASTR